MKTAWLFLSLLVLTAALPASGNAAGIHLSAAASLTDALQALQTAYEQRHPGAKILTNFGSSGTLAKQIVQGAPADIFISANGEWMDYLVKEGRISGGSLRLFAGNSLVFAGEPGNGAAGFAELAALSRIAVGSPRSVPAGRYAEQAMRAAGIYEELLAANKLVMAKDVRQALLYADRGEVDGAFVYATDARLAERARVLFTVPAALHDPIAYPAGLTVAGGKNEAVRSFFAFLTGPEAGAVLKSFGFTLPPAAEQ
ncbi:MAG: molybdate ABC transporter substrate-binding protein [Thermodesulfobacteriota bacterium]